jgi:RimJ/RimL family protein N-acetyltransferase
MQTGDATRLRAWELDDAPAVQAALVDPEIHRWTPLPQPQTVQEARDWIARRIELAATEHHEHFAVESDLAGGLAGGVNLSIGQPGRAEIGYFIAAWARRRGIASSAVRSAVRWAHDHGVERLEAVIDTENTASLAIVERAGFQREGVLRSYRTLHGVARDMYMYARLAGDP